MSERRNRWPQLLLLILAGESIFILPFVLPRVFRPTVLDAFGLDNTQLGYCYSAYGVVALLAYLFGGPLADRFPPRKLMAAGLGLTGLGGFLLASFPGYGFLRLLYGYWGFTTIFLFWAPMIKATRLWGGADAQGKAFGFLDGGRGLVGALFATLGTAVFAFFIGEVAAEAGGPEQRAALRSVILAFTGLILAAAVLVWLFLRPGGSEREVTLERIDTRQIMAVLRLPAVPLLMVIICCAYVGYKVTDVLTLYASDVLGYGEVAAAGVGATLLYARPAVGIAVGVLADRGRITYFLLGSLLLAAAGCGLFATGWVTSGFAGLFVVSCALVAAGVYAARALYFGVMRVGRIPVALTGTAVGLVSLVGYTPDIFAGPMMGYFLDGYPGLPGQRAVFAVTAGFCLVGAVAAGGYAWLAGSTVEEKNG